MPKLRDYLASDLDTFVNLDEFAKIHDINGCDILAVVDEDIQKERPRGSVDRSPASEGVFIGNVSLFVRLTDIGELPTQGSILRLNSKMYLVSTVSESEGLLEIVLEANES